MLVLFLSVLVFIFGCGGKEQNLNPKQGFNAIIIPLYSYPTDERYRGEYKKLYELNTQKTIWAIVNPNSGPGDQKDPNYEDVINRLKAKGYTVVGYVFTRYTRRDIQEVKSDVDKYMNFYPQVDGFFYDEVSNQESHVGYYTELYQYAKSKGKLVVINPGTKVPDAYYNISDIVIPFEQTPDFLLNQYRIENVRQKDCFLVHSIPDRNSAINIREYLISKGVKCAYLNNNNSWFSLSPYMDIMLE